MKVDRNDLRRCPLFGGLSNDDIERIAQNSRERSVAAGETIFMEGHPCEGFYVVASGRVKVFKLGPDGRERTLHVVSPPQAFAEAAMFGSGRYPAFAAALTDSRVILVYREPFLRLLREQPETSVRLFESMSQWLHRLVDQLENETFLNARAKLANYLLREARHQTAAGGGRAVELPQAKKDVASQLGMAPETYSRAQADLEARGLIRVSGRRIDIADATKLEDLLLGEPDEPG